MIEKRHGEKLGESHTGGSVATDAFSLAEFLGFQKIILIGQDLAYTGEKLMSVDLLRVKQISVMRICLWK